MKKQLIGIIFTIVLALFWFVMKMMMGWILPIVGLVIVYVLVMKYWKKHRK